MSQKRVTSMPIFSVGILTGISLEMTVNGIFAHDTGNTYGFFAATFLLLGFGLYLVIKQKNVLGKTV